MSQVVPLGLGSRAGLSQLRRSANNGGDVKRHGTSSGALCGFLGSKKPQYILELYAGCCRFTGACSDAGLNVAPPFDICLGAWYDVLNFRIRQFIVRLLKDQRIWFLFLGTPCTSWSIARNSRIKVPLGVWHARFSCRLIRLCVQQHIHFAIENPMSSKLWSFGPLQNAFDTTTTYRVVFDMCRYGAPYQKTTCIVTSFKPLCELGIRCRGGHYHEHLQGKLKLRCGSSHVWTWRTSVAGRYPPLLCRRLAALLGSAAPRSAVNANRQEPIRWESELRQSVGGPSGLAWAPPCCPRSTRVSWPPFDDQWGGVWRWISRKKSQDRAAGYYAL
jgi:hypothetical protein